MTVPVHDLRVVAFGGGTGMAALLSGLKSYTRNITAVVTVSDNGGSSGILRNDYDMVAPGDIRNCLIALADLDPLLARAFQYRFEEGDFKGHCFGNVFITVLTRIVGDFEDSIRALNGLLKVQGRVIPAAGARVSLVAHHPDGTKSTGEVQISRSRKPIERIELRPGPVTISEEIRDAVRQADLFLFGPGSLFTSVIPNLLLQGLIGEIRTNGSPTVYIGNIMTQPGETDGFQLSHHLRAIRGHVGDGFPDCAVAQAGSLPADVLEKYLAEQAVPVVDDLAGFPEFDRVRVVHGNFYRSGETARHDPELLAKAIHDEFLAPRAEAVEARGGRGRESPRGKSAEAPDSHPRAGTSPVRKHAHGS